MSIRVSHVFKDPVECLYYLSCYRNIVQARASDYLASHNQNICDQDHPHEWISYSPENSFDQQVLILGGMGSLAGACAMNICLNELPKYVAVSLLQWTSIPDRTGVILSHDELRKQAILFELRSAIVYGLTQFTQTPWLIVACNTAHVFLPEVLEEFPVLKNRWIRIDEAAANCCIESNIHHLLVTATSGTLACRLYQTSLSQTFIRTTYPDETAQSNLMSAIYSGIKAQNLDKTLQFGESFFLETMQKNKSIDGIIAGCTEIPELIDILRKHGRKEVRQFLDSVVVIDPIRAAAISLAKKFPQEYNETIAIAI